MGYILAIEVICIGDKSIVMKVCVETPKWSLTKYRHVDGRFVKEFTSPLPTLFNYGYIEGTTGQDGMPKDAIILGERMGQGEEVEVAFVGVIMFVDDGVEDDKMITAKNGRLTVFDRVSIHVFFSAYMVFKWFYYLMAKHRVARCRYGGVSLFPLTH